MSACGLSADTTGALRLDPAPVLSHAPGARAAGQRTVTSRAGACLAAQPNRTLCPRPMCQRICCLLPQQSGLIESPRSEGWGPHLNCCFGASELNWCSCHLTEGWRVCSGDKGCSRVVHSAFVVSRTIRRVSATLLHRSNVSQAATEVCDTARHPAPSRSSRYPAPAHLIHTHAAQCSLKAIRGLMLLRRMRRYRLCPAHSPVAASGTHTGHRLLSEQY